MSNYVSPGFMSRIILISGEDVCFVRLEAHILKLENRSRYRLAYEVQMYWKCQIMSPPG